MKAKIEWYQEVLALEPGSKVFFPLARLLGQSGQIDEAVRILRLGLERHPEHVEARMLLVELLRKLGKNSQSAKELEAVTSVFAAYPDFWDAWSEQAGGDVSFALNFLAAAFRTTNISLLEVLATGLQAMHGNTVSPTKKSRPRARSTTQEVNVPSNDPDLAVIAAALKTQDSGRDDVKSEENEPEAEPTLRTRSMADILAEQGEYQAAVDIYNELLATAQAGPEADELQKRVAELTAQINEADAVVESVSEVSIHIDEEIAVEKPKARHLLEGLAKRLDERAQSYQR